MTEPIAPVTGGVISDPDAQTAVWFLGALSQVRVSGAQTGRAFALADHRASRGNASPVHVHDLDDETFYVLAGELRILAGEEEPIAARRAAGLRRAGPGRRPAPDHDPGPAAPGRHGARPEPVTAHA
jgi:hypothetical protein